MNNHLSKFDRSPSLTAGNRQSRGFTLIELLVVIAIISLLASILIPSLNRARELTKRVTCGSSLKQIGLGMSMYAGDNSAKYPYMWTAHWPFGDFCLGPHSPPGTSYCPGFLALVPNYVPAINTFFCPTNTQFKPEYHWPYISNDKKALAGYCYWANYRTGTLTEDDVACSLKSPGDSVMASDIMTKNVPSWTSHRKGDCFDGGNVLFNDGHVEWKDENQTEERRELAGVDFWF
ncbi:MAG: type II secretion system GspH family protein [Phycisphaerae bacterium]|nr:type II secretion system GspH family protein [Phycisphaerae bacterium]